VERPEQPVQAPVSRRRADGGPRGVRVSAGEVLSSSFSIFGRNLPLLLVLGALAQALPFWLQIYQAEASARAVNEVIAGGQHPGWLAIAGGPAYLGWFLAQETLPLVLQAVIAFGVFQILKGGRPQWTESIQQGARRMPLGLGTGLLIGLGIGVPLLVMLAVVPLLSLPASVLAIFLMCMWFVAVPAAIVEGVNPLAALGRSSFLTQGARGSIFGLALLLYGLPQVVVNILQVAVFKQPDDSVTVHMPALWMEAAFGAVFGSLQAVAAVVLYHALRKSKEGVGVDELLKVFE
jgi:hypothetical protein